ncbi:MAG TPA: aldehyde dehydrogenase family protein [Jatrophihabitans sp.]|jgi:aldehyde dehydrogenase (NAD+)
MTVQPLRDFFATGRTRPFAWRATQLEALLRLISENEDTLVDAIVADLGRERSEAWLGDLAAVIAEARYARTHLRRWMRPERAHVPLILQPGRAFTQFEPLGVVLVIAPWNYPIHLALAPLVGALAGGNCAVLKPSELAPKSSAVLAELVPRYLDPHAVAVVEGDAATTTALIAEGFDHCFFTGSPAVGRIIMRAAAEHLTPVTLELGGKSPAIVAEDADLDAAAARIAFGKTMASGQTCVAPDYVLAHRAIRDELAAKIVTALGKFTDGGTLPIVNQRHLDRLGGLIASANGKVITGGAGAEDGELRLRPTVILDPDADSQLMREEIFGPVLPILTVDSVYAAIEYVRRGEKPLAAYLFTKKRAYRKRVLAEVSSGGLVHNQVMEHLFVPGIPFGGVGNSGMGAYHGRIGFETFSHRKAVLSRPSWPARQLYYPPIKDAVLKLTRRLL